MLKVMTDLVDMESGEVIAQAGDRLDGPEQERIRSLSLCFYSTRAGEEQVCQPTKICKDHCGEINCPVFEEPENYEEDLDNVPYIDYDGEWRHTAGYALPRDEDEPITY